MCVTVSATMSLSGTFFCVITTALSSPRMPMLVTAPLLMALNAYSATSTHNPAPTQPTRQRRGCVACSARAHEQHPAGRVLSVAVCFAVHACAALEGIFPAESDEEGDRGKNNGQTAPRPNRAAADPT